MPVNLMLVKGLSKQGFKPGTEIPASVIPSIAPNTGVFYLPAGGFPVVESLNKNYSSLGGGHPSCQSISARPQSARLVRHIVPQELEPCRNHSIFFLQHRCRNVDDHTLI